MYLGISSFRLEIYQMYFEISFNRLQIFKCIEISLIQLKERVKTTSTVNECIEYLVYEKVIIKDISYPIKCICNCV